MHDARSRRLALVAAFAAVVAPASAVAARCEKPCKAETAACIRARCVGLNGAAKRTCVETCRGIGGCAPIRTLAYVVNAVRSDGERARQRLDVRRGNCAPVTVMEIRAPGPLAPNAALTDAYAQARFGHFSVVAAFFQRLSVTPDGAGVVFEVTDDVAVLPIFPLPADFEEGFYFVRAGGAGLRRIGPQSGVPRAVAYEDPSIPGGLNFGGFAGPQTDISPHGRTFVFTDWGQGPAGETAIQVVTLDIATGKRTVVTRLPPGTSRSPYANVTEFPRFVDDDTILFVSYANPDGLNPDRYYMFFTVNVDGTGLRAVGTPTASAGSRVLPTFSIAGGGTNLMNMAFFDAAGDHQLFQELFILDGKRLLQLTNFGRSDTGRLFLTRNRRRAFFRAAADPLGTNPSGNCQLFSVDTFGAHLRQVTSFREGERSALGCGIGSPPGCTINEAFQDSATGEVVFYSSCDPFGTNVYGSQIFAMRPDSTKLRQLTATRGRRIESSGVVSVELPGPWAYSARSR